MKKILFVIPHLGCGGAEKELITLLCLMDHAKWQIDLFLFEDVGMFRDFVPDHVRVLPRDQIVSIWNRSGFSSVLSLLIAGKWRLAINRIRFGIELRIVKSHKDRSHIVWNYYRKLLPPCSDRYDVAMSYMEGMSNYYVNEMVVADRKLASLHNNYEKMPHLNRKLDESCFEKMDAIVTDSEGCREIIAQAFPKLKDKFHAIECFISPAMIMDMSMKQEDPFADNFKGIRILTVGRITNQKGIDLAVKACKILKDLGYHVRWYVLGDGEDLNAISDLIASLMIQQDFLLLGTRTNHYPFIAACDIYVQPSRWEGWGIAIEEAKVLAKPVVLTRFPIAESRIDHMKTGIVVDIQEHALAQGIARLINEPQLRDSFHKNLKELKLGSDKEMHEFNHLINGN